MSAGDAQEFLKQLGADPGLAERAAAEQRRLLVSLGAERGLEFSEAELAEAAQTLQDAPFGEVPEWFLSTVTGGGYMNELGGADLDAPSRPLF